MLRYFYLLLFVFSFLISCNPNNQQNTNPPHFDEQAHRGGRGLMPENTIASAKMAIDYGCTMEMDLQMTKDKKIIVSHDPYINSKFALTPEGDTMSVEESKSRLIYHMPYDSVARYDVGSKTYSDFPRQQKMHAKKPLLSSLIDSAEAYAETRNHTNFYNIEIKSSPGNDGKTYSSLEEFVDLTMAIIENKNIESRTMIQSFDIRALNQVHENYPGVKTSYLVSGSNKESVKNYIEQLGFTPDIFSPHFSIVTEDMVNAFHQLNVLVIPWTPNAAEEIQSLKDMGVDGVITDYPDLFAQID